MSVIDTVRSVLGGDGRDRTADPSLLDRCRAIAATPRTVTLDDGRELGYADCGDPDGDPVLVFHGFPNSRVFGALFDEVGREHGVRVLAPERPGIGVSDPRPGRGLTDWPDDAAGFLDALGVEACPVFGVSAGGPYALACAALAPDRVERAGVGVGVGPPSAVGVRERAPYLLARYATPLARYLIRRDGRRAREDPEAYLEARAGEGAPADGPYWRGEIGRALLLTGVEARRHHGNAGLARDLAVLGKPWGFDLGSIDVPTALWYGKDDRIVPVEMGYHLARAVPVAEAHFYPERGHISTLVENQASVVEWLLGE
jgi:pimeloyl-ACP methyl ester carboxylesterase